MALAKWQNITQPSGAIFSFLSWDNQIGCQYAKNTSTRVERVFLVTILFQSTVVVGPHKTQPHGTQTSLGYDRPIPKSTSAM